MEAWGVLKRLPLTLKATFRHTIRITVESAISDRL